ncbi:neurolysin, mitochondrial isoform X4 [Phyllopteryx taeniolatus]|uniref:neurolysin, mitochondrial isoform X4 n=1 Tax=Phyllopteryx taeniolatus TaxID=161469 RepID=UPI002AD3AD1E|nr:neurolysin, mitochondrial isoform X4 [Phyllopteryx taeniolatus]
MCRLQDGQHKTRASGASVTVCRDPNTLWRMTILNGAVLRPARDDASSTPPLRWDRSAEDILADTERLIGRVKKVYDEIGRVHVDAVSVENTLRALANVKMEYAACRHSLDFPQYVSPCKAVRLASTEADKRLCDLDVELSMREDVFLRIVALQEKKLPENASAEEKRFLERLVATGRRNGLHLCPEMREQIKRTSKLISELSIEFNKNLNEDNTFLPFSRQQLDGLAESFLSGLDVDQGSGLYKVTLAYPHYFPVMKRCRDPETRRKMETAFHSRCKEANTIILERLVSLRAEVAVLLGYSCHADYVLEVNVAKNATNVDAFLRRESTATRRVLLCSPGARAPTEGDASRWPPWWPTSPNRPGVCPRCCSITRWRRTFTSLDTSCTRSAPSGMMVESDFVEVPSQMLENWVWEKEPLRRMSRHYKDGSAIPEALLDKLIASRVANTGLMNLRQVLLSKADQSLHTSSSADSAAVFAKHCRDVLGVPATEGTNMMASFDHLAGGYDAQYYSYLWSEVYSTDIYFSRFKKEGILNPNVGKEYRRVILEAGGSADGMDMLERFLGRAPCLDAFFRCKGLTCHSDAAL